MQVFGSRLSVARRLALTLTLCLITLPVLAMGPHGLEEGARHYDARIDHNVGLRMPVASTQGAALDALRVGIPELAATFEPTTGVTRTLYNRTGYLTEAREGTPLRIALDYVSAQAGALGLSRADLAAYQVQDEVLNPATGATHLYLIQEHLGLPVYNAQLHVNVNRDGRVISVNNAFLPDMVSAVGSVVPSISAAEALRSTGRHLGLDSGGIELLGEEDDVRQTTRLAAPELSTEPVEAKLAWLPIRVGEARLVWNLQIATLDSNHLYDLNVDAGSGQVWTRIDWVSDGTYQVYEEPVESPIHTSPAPPADARTSAVNPEDGTASPSGWFSGGVMDGNNVHAYDDRDNNNAPPGGQPSCSGTTCNFPINLNNVPSTYVPAAVTNLFYWNNYIHDVQYQYGFTEAAGNFQENNFGRGGAGSDSVNAEAQDGGGNCNANMLTPPDGSNPRMQMYTCNRASPSHDGDFDNGVIVHEYGHGISNRQVGGPSNVSCLGNLQQAGEGWSDWLGLAYTAEASDQGADRRGLGAYLFNLAPDGTIRPQNYSTDPAINTYTYVSISGLSIPHGVGSVWAQAAWEMYWALVDKHGFSTDLGTAGAAGNQRAMLYINEGLQNTACSPTFVNNRDGIIQAATDNFGGEDVCTLWEAFAAFGLGTDAISGGSNSTSPTNGFSIPASCQGGGFQAGVETIDERVRTVALSGFTTPRVVMGPPSFAGSHASTIRVTNVTASSFSHNLQEWDYLDGNHANESIGYLVLENGSSSLGGLGADAGAVTINQNWTTVSFGQSFVGAPVVVAQVTTLNGSQAVTTRIRNVTSASFQVRLQEEEGNDGTHNPEVVHWIAVQTGSTTAGGRQVVVGRTGDVVTHAWHSQGFSPAVPGAALLADMQTFDGGDTAALRHRNLTSTSFEVKVEEEQSANTEVGHVTENVGYILIGN